MARGRIIKAILTHIDGNANQMMHILEYGMQFRIRAHAFSSCSLSNAKARGGKPQPRKFNHGFHGFHG
jgi:hypothetical protein